MRARTLSETLGAPALRRLCRWRGGAEIYVPLSPGPEHPITLALGAPAAAALAAAYGGRRIYVPRRALDPARARELLARGLPVREVARRMGCSTRWVREARRRTSARDAVGGDPEPGAW